MKVVTLFSCLLIIVNSVLGASGEDGVETSKTNFLGNILAIMPVPSPSHHIW